MALEDLNPRIAAIMLLGFAVTVIFVMSGTDFWNHKYLEGTAFLVVASGLTFSFFRRRLVALALVGLPFILVMAGLTAAFHPSIAGVLFIVGSATALLFIIRWHARKFPNLGSKDWKTIFENR